MSVTRALGELRRAPVNQVPLVIPDSETEGCVAGITEFRLRYGRSPKGNSNEPTE